MKKHKLIIVPSSDDEGAFEDAGTFEQAKKVMEENEDASSAAEFSFDSEHDMNTFIEGYKAAIGYLGNGLFYIEKEN